MDINKARAVTSQVFTNKDTKHIPVCWVGGSGTGKTSEAHVLGKELGKEVVTVTLFSDDAVGINTYSKKENVISFMIHDIIHEACEKPAILYLDEINRTDRNTYDPLMRLVRDRRVGAYKIHEDTNILLTVNPETEQYDTLEPDKAFKTRCIAFPIKNTIECVEKYCINNGLENVLSYVTNNPEILNDDLHWNVEVDTRLLEYLNRIIKVIDDKKIIREIVEFSLKDKGVKSFLDTSNASNLFDQLKNKSFEDAAKFIDVVKKAS